MSATKSGAEVVNAGAITSSGRAGAADMTSLLDMSVPDVNDIVSDCRYVSKGSKEFVMSAVTSRVVRFHHTGEPMDVLVEEVAEVPDPGPGRIRVRVLAVGLNPADLEICRGFQPGTLPRGIGCDAAGIVDALGDGVADVAVGDLVFGAVDFAGQASAGIADHAVLTSWYPLPEGLDPAAAATLPMVVVTARWTLDLLDPPPGSTLLVHGAGGMVGFVTVQIALARGLRVLATAGPTFAGDLRDLGAQVTSYGPGMPARVRELAGGDVDLVLDTSRPQPGVIQELIGLTGGDPRRVVTISNHAEAREQGARVNIDELLAGKSLPSTDFLAEYAESMAHGDLRIPIARRFAFADWEEAVELILSGHPRGKLVIQLDGEQS